MWSTLIRYDRFEWHRYSLNSNLYNIQTGHKAQNLGASGWSSIPITFEKPFNSSPNVIICKSDASSTDNTSSVTNITKNGFDWIIYRETSDNFTFSINWIAVSKD